MARRTAAEKAETRDRILKRAAQAFRANGTGVGIGELMGELGLTHGGFYRHFASKDDLVVEAVTQAIREMRDRLVRAAERAEPGAALTAIITTYLSPEHLGHPETWCVFAAMGPDIGRLPAAARKKLDREMLAYTEALSSYIPGDSPEARQATLFVLLSGMAGAISMIRVLGDRAMREQVLGLARDYYLRSFTTSA